MRRDTQWYTWLDIRWDTRPDAKPLRTTGIEGNTLDEKRIETVMTEASDQTMSALSIEEREVLNAEKVHRFITEHAKKNASGLITEEMVKTIHALTTDSCDYKNNVPGEYRKFNVSVTDYYPPDHAELQQLMARFFKLINSRDLMDGYKALIRAIIAHFYLISIHPFGDGNGRTSRAIEAYILYQNGYNVRGFYSLANYFYRNRQQYIEKLQEARFRHNGNLTDFVEFSLKGFVSELESIQDEILAYVRQVLFRDVYLEVVRAKKIPARLIALLEFLTFDGTSGIRYEAARSKAHYLIAGLYENLTTKTLSRDLRLLMDLQLVVVDSGVIKANLGLMN